MAPTSASAARGAVLAIQTTIERVEAEIRDLGDQMRALSRRYETLFPVVGVAFAEAADDEADLAGAAQAVLLLLDAAAAGVTAHLPSPRAIDCRPGCASCCHLAVATPPGVADLIASYVVGRFSEAERRALWDRLVEAAAEACAAPDPALVRRACPLLGEDGCCSVYPVRPIACRAFTSTSVALCRRLLQPGPDPGGIEQHPTLYRLHREATAALEATARRRGLPDRQRGLAEDLLDALTIRDPGLQSAD